MKTRRSLGASAGAVGTMGRASVAVRGSAVAPDADADADATGSAVVAPDAPTDPTIVPGSVWWFPAPLVADALAVCRTVARWRIPPDPSPAIARRIVAGAFGNALRCGRLAVLLGDERPAIGGAVAALWHRDFRWTVDPVARRVLAVARHAPGPVAAGTDRFAGYRLDAGVLDTLLSAAASANGTTGAEGAEGAEGTGEADGPNRPVPHRTGGAVLAEAAAHFRGAIARAEARDGREASADAVADPDSAPAPALAPTPTPAPAPAPAPQAIGSGSANPETAAPDPLWVVVGGGWRWTVDRGARRVIAVARAPHPSRDWAALGAWRLHDRAHRECLLAFGAGAETEEAALAAARAALDAALAAAPVPATDAVELRAHGGWTWALRGTGRVVRSVARTGAADAWPADRTLRWDGARVSHHARLRVVQRVAPGWWDETAALRRARLAFGAAAAGGVWVAGEDPERPWQRTLLHDGWAWGVGADTRTGERVLTTLIPPGQGDAWRHGERPGERGGEPARA